MHKRVIPRDFFNESKLLKCLGAFTINAQRYPNIESIEDDDSGKFCIELGESGELFCSNYKFALNGEFLFLFTPYNSQGIYPLYVRRPEADIEVLTDEGYFSEEFKKLISKKEKNNGLCFM